MANVANFQTQKQVRYEAGTGVVQDFRKARKFFTEAAEVPLHPTPYTLHPTPYTLQWEVCRAGLGDF